VRRKESKHTTDATALPGRACSGTVAWTQTNLVASDTLNNMSVHTGPVGHCLASWQHSSNAGTDNNFQTHRVLQQ
jgi:hypothetical protein